MNPAPDSNSPGQRFNTGTLRCVLIKTDLHIVSKHESPHTLNRRVCCPQLRNNAFTFTPVLDHLLNAPNLPLDPSQPVQYRVNGEVVQPNQEKLAEASGQYQPAKEPSSSITTHLKIFIPRTGNLVQDKHRLKTVYGLLVQNPGRDRFSLYIPSGDKTTRVDFPNHTTQDSAHLRQQLIQLLGVGTVRTE